MSKTLFLYDQCGEEPLTFFELEGDYSHLNGAYINSTTVDEAVQEELNEILFTEDGHLKVLTFKEPTKDWTHFVIVGFLP